MVRLILLFGILVLVRLDASTAQDFTKLTGDPVVSDLRYSEGASWGDINNDGYIDVFVPHLHTDLGNTIFINEGDGSFVEMVSGPIVTDDARSTGGSFGDFDNDGDLDLFVSNYYGLSNLLYLNNGDGAFTRITEGSVVTDGGFSFGSSIIDYDNDGFLDIYVTNGAQVAAGENNFLYRNNGDGTFERITNGALVNDSEHSSASSWCDYDHDGDPDLFVANGFTDNAAEVDNKLYQNNGDGTFTMIDPVAIGIEHSHSSSGSWADYDNDGDFDLFITNFLGHNNYLYQNNGDGTFTRLVDGIINNDGGDSVSSTWGDYDNDGDLDLYVTNDFNENNDLYQNNGDGTFAKLVDGDPSNDGGRSNGATWADYDNDGYLDLYVPNGQRPARQSNNLYRNAGVSGNSWINIKCIGTISNASAIGTKVRAKALTGNKATWQLRQVSGSSGFNAQNSFNIEFGLGQADRIDSLVIEWPSGLIDIFANVEAGVFYEAREGGGLDAIPTAVQPHNLMQEGFRVYPNYPNPFNRTTTLRYEIAKPARVRLTLFTASGQRVAELVHELKRAGIHEIKLDVANLSTGVYFYRLEAGHGIKSGKVVYFR